MKITLIKKFSWLTLIYKLVSSLINVAQKIIFLKIKSHPSRLSSFFGVNFRLYILDSPEFETNVIESIIQSILYFETPPLSLENCDFGKF